MGSTAREKQPARERKTSPGTSADPEERETPTLKRVSVSRPDLCTVRLNLRTSSLTVTLDEAKWTRAYGTMWYTPRL